MNSTQVERMRARVRAVKSRAAVRQWSYRQRNLAAGVWFRLRRVLADAKSAYEISEADAGRLVTEGYRRETCGTEVSPEKIILFVDPARLSAIAARPIPVGLGPEFMAARAVALIRFDDQQP